ncbi:MAG: tRNA pseudouridine(38-40) synthase TruA [Actinomycetia bacterium]|nr:tRNA pseudouridine(38-40) synthase TruA [Actinomycetes bacterium]
MADAGARLAFGENQESADSLTGAIGIPLEAADDSSPNECTLALTIAYRGGDFHGFARQEGTVTVQGELEQALATLYRRPVLTVGAGRTDTGVHALGQVASYALSEAELAERPLPSLCASLNALTPDGIVVRNAQQKPPGFSARFSALEREYRYRIVPRATPPLFLAPYAWWLPGEILDINRIREAIPFLLGEHDFRSFCRATSAEGKNTVRTLKNISVFGTDHLGEHCIVIQVVGTAFLHSMVRIIVGSLVEVGQGRRDPSWLRVALEAADRRAAGPTAPAHGLTFWRVRY